MHLRPVFALLLTLTLAPAHRSPAQEKLSAPPREAPAPTETAPSPATCLPAPVRTIPNNKYYLVDVEAPATITTLRIRPVEVARTKETTVEIDWKEEVVTVTELESKKRPVEQEVTWLETQEVKAVDPSTGCTRITCKQVPVTKRVTITVEELVPVERRYTVRTPVLKPVEREVVVKKLTVDCVTEPAIRKSLRLVEWPGEIKVPLPPPACPLPCLP